MKQLIVNADDFGLTEGVNRGIIHAHLRGIVSSTTLMANGLAFESAVSKSKLATGLGVGVHLNLTEGTPISRPSSIPTLVDARNRLHLSPLRLWAGVAAGRVHVSDIETELRAQIMKVVRAGVRPTHLDGHKHIHVVPSVSDVVIRLALEFGIPAVRCPLEDDPHPAGLFENRAAQISIIKQYFVGRGVSRLARSLRKKLTRARLAFPRHFYGLSQTGFLDARGVEEILERLPMGTSELMCHPGYLDTALERSGTRLVIQRETEVHALGAAREVVFASAIELCTYRELGRPTEQMEQAA